MVDFGRDPARGFVERVPLTPSRTTQRRGTWISAIGTVNNKNLTLLPCRSKPGWGGGLGRGEEWICEVQDSLFGFHVFGAEACLLQGSHGSRNGPTWLSL